MLVRNRGLPFLSKVFSPPHARISLPRNVTTSTHDVEPNALSGEGDDSTRVSTTDSPSFPLNQGLPVEKTSLASITCCTCLPSVYRVVEPEENAILEDIRLLLMILVFCALPCLAGNLDVVAPIVSVLYIFTYFSINVTCFLLALVKGSMFRPRFGFEAWWVSLFGMVSCVVVSLLLSWWLTLIVVFAFIVLSVHALHHKENAGIGEALYGLLFQVARNILAKLDNEDSESFALLDPQSMDPITGTRPSPSVAKFKSQQLLPDWRPKILVLARPACEGLTGGADLSPALSSSNLFPNLERTIRSSSFANRHSSRAAGANEAMDSSCTVLKPESSALIRLAGQIKTERGVTLVSVFLRGECGTNDMQEAGQMQQSIQEFLRRQGICGFSQVAVVSDVGLAQQLAVQNAGLGPLKPNTVRN